MDRARIARATWAGAALVFDEMKADFRLATGGYQQLSGVTPDLAAFGKALANGYPLTVCAAHDLMDCARRMDLVHPRERGDGARGGDGGDRLVRVGGSVRRAGAHRTRDARLVSSRHEQAGSPGEHAGDRLHGS
jgi:hypothetical protein